MISKLAAWKDLKSSPVHSNIGMWRSAKFVYAHAPCYFMLVIIDLKIQIQLFNLKCNFHNELLLKNEDLYNFP